MAMAILKSLVQSLALTLLLEIAAAGLLGMRTMRDFLLVALVNILTNPLLGLILDGVWLGLGIWPRWYLILPLEAAVVTAEGFLYRGRLEYDKINPLILSAVLNGISYLGGLLV